MGNKQLNQQSYCIVNQPNTNVLSFCPTFAHGGRNKLKNLKNVNGRSKSSESGWNPACTVLNTDKMKALSY